VPDPFDVEELADEVAQANFADERLNKRLRMLVAGLAKDPSLSLPESFDSAGLEAAYRFFSNVHVTPPEILASHFAATRARCEQGDFLIAHDSTTFSYRYDGEREGLGRAQRSNPRSNQAFYAHLSLALAADGTRRPLGVAAFKTWVRGPVRSGIEYQRWEEQIRSASAQSNGAKRAIHLADREADDYEMFCALIRDEHRFVMRCLSNRLLEDPAGKIKLREHFAGLEATVEREVPLFRRTQRRTAILRKINPAREARLAKLSITAATVVLKKPTSPRKHSKQPPQTQAINVVRVWEPSPPEGAEPVEWYLYTTEPIGTPEQQLAVVDYYRARWVIEEYFKAIKKGCEFEKRQLQDYESLANLLATFLPIAYRLLLIRTEAARAPEQSALTVVSQDELDVLRTLGRRKLPPAPTAQDAYLAIAALGGHIKYNGDPGWLTLARGFEKLATLTEGWCAAKLQPIRDQ